MFRRWRVLGGSERGEDRQAQEGITGASEGRVGPHEAGRVGKAGRQGLPREGKAGLRGLLGLRHVDRGGGCGRGRDEARGGGGVAEALMLGERGHAVELLAALGAVDLHAAFGVHALVPAEVRELGVGLEADLALERLDAAVDVGVLLEAAAGREGLAALGASVAPGAHVSSPDVPL